MRLTRRRWAVFGVTALGAFMGSLDLSIVNVAFPSLARSFPHDSGAALAWVITAYAIVFAALLVTAGRTADRLGRRRVYFWGLAVFTLGSALCGLAPSVALLVVGRVIQGAGAALLLPASLGLLLDAFPPERRAQMVALWSGVAALAVATGPSVGALVVTAGGWRWAFYLNVPIGVLTLSAGRTVLADDRPAARATSPDLVGVALVTVALAGLVLGISEGPGWGWGDPRVVAGLAAAAVLGAAFARRCARHPDPVLDLTLFRSRAFAAANAATVVYAMGFFAMLLGNILFLTGVWGYSILAAGRAVTPGPLVVAVVSGPAGRLVGRLGFAPLLLTGLGVFAVGLAWFVVRVGLHPDFAGTWLPGTLIVGAGIGLSFPVLGAAAVSALPQDRFAVGSAVNQSSRQVGGALGIAILVAILGPAATAAGAGAMGDALALTRFDHLWAYAAIATGLAGVICAFIRSPRRALAAPSATTTAVAAATAPSTAATGDGR